MGKRRIEHESQDIYSFGYRLHESTFNSLPYIALASVAALLVSVSLDALSDYSDPAHQIQDDVEDVVYAVGSLTLLGSVVGSIIFWGAKSLYNNRAKNWRNGSK